MSALIFVSHAAVDEEIAKAIKTHLNAAFPTLDIFVSSDPEDLPPGSEWVEKILDALVHAKLVVSVTTQRGLSRKWVWFESGRTWRSGIECIPCCIGKVRKSELPTPFSFLQAVNLDEEAGFSALLNRCEKVFGLMAEPVQPRTIADEFVRLDVRAEERQLTVQDPFSSELEQEVDQGMRRLDPGSREVLRILLKFGQLTDAVARLKSRESGKYTNDTMFVTGLANQTGWLIKIRSGSQPHVTSEDDVYEVNARVRVHLLAWFARHA